MTAGDKAGEAIKIILQKQNIMELMTIRILLIKEICSLEWMGSLTLLFGMAEKLY